MTKRIYNPRHIFIVALLFTLVFAFESAQAQTLSQKERVRVVCAAAQLWVAVHQASSDHDKNKFTAGAMRYMKIIPQSKHFAIDVALGQLAGAAYSQVYSAATNCERSLPR